MIQRFSFNLLPEKSKKVEQKEEKRDKNALYLAFMPLVAVIVAIGFMLFNTLVVDRQIEDINASIEENEEFLASAQTIQAVKNNTEFVQKSEVLEEPIQRDIEPEELFVFAEEFQFSLNFRTTIVAYGRDNDGSVNLILSFPSLLNTIEVMEAFEKFERDGDIEFPNPEVFTYDPLSDTTRMTVNFFIVDEEDSDA